jgi:hypothetical protein
VAGDFPQGGCEIARHFLRRERSGTFASDHHQANASTELVTAASEHLANRALETVPYHRVTDLARHRDPELRHARVAIVEDDEETSGREPAPHALDGKEIAPGSHPCRCG